MGFLAHLSRLYCIITHAALVTEVTSVGRFLPLKFANLVPATLLAPSPITKNSIKFSNLNCWKLILILKASVVLKVHTGQLHCALQSALMTSLGEIVMFVDFSMCLCSRKIFFFWGGVEIKINCLLN